MDTITGQFELSAEIDGTTINACLISNRSLEQYFNGANHEVTPNWQDNENLQPTIFLVVRDTTTGQVIPSKDILDVQWAYNQQTVTFAEKESLNNNESFPGLFQRMDAIPPALNVSVPALKVKKNFPQFGNNDNDTISCNGAINYDGQRVDFKDISIDVVVKEKVGDIYTISITDEHNFSLQKGYDKTMSKAYLLKGNSEMDAKAMEGISFKWERLTNDGYVAVPASMVSGEHSSFITIGKDFINSVLQLRCSAFQQGVKDPLATVNVSYTDSNDPLHIVTAITLKGGGIMTGKIHRGQTAVVTPKVKSILEDKADFTNLYNFTYRLIKNDGNPMGDEQKGSSIEVDFTTVVMSGLKVKGNIIAKKIKQ